MSDSTDNNTKQNIDDIVSVPLKEVAWTTEHEDILIEWADKAMCYRWLHSRSNALYSNLNAWYTIPVIIISTLTGTANFAQERVPINYQSYFVMLVGGFNILAGIISTIQQFLKVTQLTEAHRVSSIAWDKFYRNVKIELAKHPIERTNVTMMIKICKEEFDRLMETSPVIPDKIIREFKASFKNSESFKDVVKPEICDVMISTEKFRNPWSNTENQEKNMQELINMRQARESKQKSIANANTLMLGEFKKTFFDLHNRKPMDSEIIDNLKDRIEISVLTKLIDSHKDSNKDSNMDSNTDSNKDSNMDSNTDSSAINNV